MARIGDLGCGSGVLAAWLAKQHPEFSVTGWDAIKTMIEAASSSQIAPKLAFATWNYATEPCPEPHSCDVLVSCFGIDFPIDGQSHRQSLDAPTLRTNNYYHKMLGVLCPYFHCWRTAIRDQGVLHAVLRIPSPVLFLATIDAAHHEGWTLDAGQYEYLTVGVESFPAMTLKAASGPVITEELALSLWSRHALRATFAEPITDPAAACVFHSLADRTILKTESRTYDDGHTMQALVGRAAFIGFQYTHATTGFGRLKLMSLDDAEHAEPWFPQPSFDDMF
jgi:SAM-dependent methyltransferase